MYLRNQCLPYLLLISIQKVRWSEVKIRIRIDLFWSFWGTRKASSQGHWGRWNHIITSQHIKHQLLFWLYHALVHNRLSFQMQQQQEPNVMWKYKHLKLLVARIIKVLKIRRSTITLSIRENTLTHEKWASGVYISSPSTYFKVKKRTSPTTPY